LPENSKEKISERSWFLTREEIGERNYDLKAVNNNAPDFTDKRTPKELYSVILEAQKEIQKELAGLMKE
jgi:hypothetical protein